MTSLLTPIRIKGAGGEAEFYQMCGNRPFKARGIATGFKKHDSLDASASGGRLAWYLHVL
jgi:hypothetical protein